MNWLKTIENSKIPTEHIVKFHRSIIDNDIKKGRILLWAVIFFELFLLLMTCLDGPSDLYGAYLHTYRNMYIIMIAVSMFIQAFVRLYVKSSSDIKESVFFNIEFVYLLFMITWGGVINVIDMSRGINSIVFLFVLFTISIVFYLPPIRSIILYGFSLILYLVLVEIFIDDQTAAMSGYVNVTTIIVVAWIISYVQCINRRKQFKSDIKITEQNEKLNRLVDIDPLTNAFNRRSLDKSLTGIISDAKISGKMISVMMIDIDNFKMINDQVGHIRGDEILIQISSIIKKNVHSYNSKVFRYGGDEFCVITHGIDAQEADKLVQRIKEAVSNIDIGKNDVGSDQTVSVTIGSSNLDPNISSEESIWLSIREADKALYIGKGKRLKRRQGDM